MDTMWKWIAGIFLALTLSFGGYIWNGMDNRHAAGEQRIVQLEVELAQEIVRSDVQYKEIQRRLANIEMSLTRIEDLIRRPNWR